MTDQNTGGNLPGGLATVPSQFPVEKSEDLKRLKLLDRGLPDAFPEGQGRLPNNPVIAAVVAALFKGGASARVLQGGWFEDQSGRVCYRHIGKKGGQVVVYVDTLSGDTSPEAQWAVVENFSVLTADVLVVLLAQLCEAGALAKTRGPAMEPISISASAIMRYKEMTRWGEERAQFRDRIAEEVDSIYRLRFDVLDFPAFDPQRGSWRPEGVSFFGDRVLEIACTVGVPPQDAKRSFADHYWHVRFGQWGLHWMNSQGKVWLSPIPKAVVALDHRKNRGVDVLAKKLGVSTLLLWGAARSRSHLDRRIDSLLESVGELPEATERSAHWAGRMFDRMVDAGLLLEEKGLLRLLYDSGECVPPDFERNKGWVKGWLASKLQVERPDYLNTP